MTTHARPMVVSTRVSPTERALIRALAEAEQASVCEVVHSALIPAVRTRLNEILKGAGLALGHEDESR